MPPVVAILGGGAAIFAGSALGLSFLTYIGASLIIGAAADALMPKPDENAFEGADRSVMIRQAITPHRIIYGQVKVSGPLTFVHTTNANQVVYILLTLACHEVEEIGAIYFGDETIPFVWNASGYWEVTTGRWAGVVRAWKGLGTAAGDADLLGGLATFCNPPWVSNHWQDGRAKLMVELVYHQDLFPSGLPNISTLVKGRKVYDPREGGHDFDDPTTWEWSANAALCIGDYLYGYDAYDVPIGLGATEAEVDWTTLTAAANLCDEAVALDAGGTEDRYTAHGTITKDEAPKTALGRLLTSCGGTLVRSAGLWVLHGAGYRSPTVSFDEDDLAGPIKIAARVSRRELFNAAKGVFISPDHSWQPTDAPPVTSATYLAEDGGVQNWADFNFPFTTSSTTAQRLLKINLERVRRQITVQAPFKLSALKVMAADTLQFSLTRMGWSSKVFELVDWSFSQTGDADAPLLVVELILRETDSNVYAWSSSEEGSLTIPAATDLPDPYTVAAPASLVVTESLYETSGEIGVKAKAALTWTASTDGFFLEHVIERRLAGTGDYVEYGRTVSDEFTFLDIAPADYDFRVKAINTIGVSSSYVTALAESIDGLLADLDDVENLRLAYKAGKAMLTWDAVDDVRAVIYEIRTGSTIWSTARLQSSQTSLEYFPSVKGTYLVKARSGEAYSTNPASITLDDAILSGNVKKTQDEHTDWSGTFNGSVRPAFPTVWDNQFDGSFDPQGLLGWNRTGVDHATSDGDIFTIEPSAGNGADQCYYTRTAPQATWDSGDALWIWNKVGVDSGSNFSCWFGATLDNPGAKGTFEVRDTKLRQQFAAGYQEYDVDFTTAREIMVCLSAAKLWAWVKVSGVWVLAMSGAPRTSTGGPAILFGKTLVVDREQAQNWDWFHHTVNPSLEGICLIGAEGLSGSYEIPAADIVDLGYDATSTVTCEFSVRGIDHDNDLLDIANLLLEANLIKGTPQVTARPEIRLYQAGAWGSWRELVNGEYTAQKYNIRLWIEVPDATVDGFVGYLTWTVDMPDRDEPYRAQSILAGGTTITHSPAFQATPTTVVSIVSSSDGDTPILTAESASGFTLQVLDKNGAGVARTCNIISKGY